MSNFSSNMGRLWMLLTSLALFILVTSILKHFPCVHTYISFYTYIILGNEKIIDLLIKNTTDLNARGIRGDTPLYQAIDTGSLIYHLAYSIRNFLSFWFFFWILENEKIVDLLLKRGADPFAENYQNKTALRNAIEIGNKKIVKLLIKKVTDLNFKDKNGSTPLHWAANNSRYLLSDSMCDLTLQIYVTYFRQCWNSWTSHGKSNGSEC